MRLGRKYDPRGNIIETPFGVDGKPTVQTDGVAGWRGRYSVRGHRIETTYIGIDGKPSVTMAGGRLEGHLMPEGSTRQEHVGLSGELIVLKDGYTMSLRRERQRSSDRILWS